MSNLITNVSHLQQIFSRYDDHHFFCTIQQINQGYSIFTQQHSNRAKDFLQINIRRTTELGGQRVDRLEFFKTKLGLLQQMASFIRGLLQTLQTPLQ